MLTVTFILLASMSAAQSSIGGGPTEKNCTAQSSPSTALVDQSPIAKETKAQTQLWTNIDRVLEKIPEGTAVDQTQFESAFGTDQAALLLQAGLVSITSVNKPGTPHHFVLAFASPGATHTSSGDLVHERTVEFDSKTVNGRFEMEHIKGVTGKGIITVTIDDVKIAHLPGGNTSLTGHGRKIIPLGSKTFIFAPDGQQVLGAASGKSEPVKIGAGGLVCP